MKNKLLVLFTITMLVTGFKSQGQVVTDHTTVINTPDKKPEYKKGIRDWIDFLEAKLDRDLLQRQGAPAGKYIVIASFLVDIDGSVSDIKIEQDRGYGTGDEVKRIIKLTDKKWSPAYDKGVAIPFRHRQSITFANNVF